MTPEEEQDKLAAGFAKMGANNNQAQAMAQQIRKRADQLVAERSMTREEAMAYLLSLVAAGRTGEPHPDFPGLENEEA